MAILGRCHATRRASQPPVLGTVFYLQLFAKLQQSQHFHGKHYQRGICTSSRLSQFSPACLILKHYFSAHCIQSGLEASVPAWLLLRLGAWGHPEVRNGSVQSLQVNTPWVLGWECAEPRCTLQPLGRTGMALGVTLMR